MIGGKEQKAYGRVCPQPDGSWRFEPPPELPQPPQPGAPVTTSEVYPPSLYPTTGGSVFFGSSVFFGQGHRHGYPHYW
jgi:hypothetical protein